MTHDGPNDYAETWLIAKQLLREYEEACREEKWRAAADAAYELTKATHNLWVYAELRSTSTAIDKAKQPWGGYAHCGSQ